MRRSVRQLRGNGHPYEKLGGPHHVSLKVVGSDITNPSVGAGQVFCHVNEVPGEGNITTTFGLLSGFPAAPLYTGHFTNGEKPCEYDVTDVRTKPGAGWTTSKRAFLQPGPRYVILYGSTQPDSSIFTEKTLGLQIQYGATAKGVFNGAGPDECYAEGGLSLRPMGP